VYKRQVHVCWYEGVRATASACISLYRLHDVPDGVFEEGCDDLSAVP
jgi:hypothetical protein